MPKPARRYARRSASIWPSLSGRVMPPLPSEEIPQPPEPRAYQRDALPIRVAFRPSVAFSGELVELITPEFRNLQRWVPGQPPKKRRASEEQCNRSRHLQIEPQLRQSCGSQFQWRMYNATLPGLHCGGIEEERSSTP